MNTKSKFIFCVGSSLYPVHVDDPNIEHEAYIIIENVEKNFRICLGLDRDDELSRPYQPYCTRVLSLEKMKELRDGLNKLIKIHDDDLELVWICD